MGGGKDEMRTLKLGGIWNPKKKRKKKKAEELSREEDEEWKMSGRENGLFIPGQKVDNRRKTR